MGNCQAAEASMVVLQHPGNTKAERIYWSVSANEVMSSNPGHYVALVVDQPKNNNRQSAGVKNYLKLLRPDDTLHIGNVYRLVRFEDVIKEISAKKSVKFGKLLKQSGDLGGSNASDINQAEGESEQLVSSIRRAGRHHGGLAWKPALQSIAES